jgi:hypothetical protein
MNGSERVPSQLESQSPLVRRHQTTKASPQFFNPQSPHEPVKMSAAAASSGGGEIDLSRLDLNALKSLQKQLDDELKNFETNFSQLKDAQQKFADSAAAIQALPAASEGGYRFGLHSLRALHDHKEVGSAIP